MEGKYWKRDYNVISAEYKKWRRFYHRTIDPSNALEAVSVLFSIIVIQRGCVWIEGWAVVGFLIRLIIALDAVNYHRHRIHLYPTDGMPVSTRIIYRDYEMWVVGCGENKFKVWISLKLNSFVYCISFLYIQLHYYSLHVSLEHFVAVLPSGWGYRQSVYRVNIVVVVAR